AAGIAGLPGCGDAPPAPTAAPAEDVAPAAATNRIDVPPGVRRNLGVTFATVERRPVRQTVRVPGQFELRPEARREYRTMVPGRVELLVRQFDRVSPGQAVARIDSPEWRARQHQAVEAQGEIKLAQAALAVAQARREEATQAHAFAQGR